MITSVICNTDHLMITSVICNTDGCSFDDHFCHLDCSCPSFSPCPGCLDSKLCTDKCTVDTCRQLPSCLLFGFLSANNRSVPKTDCIFIHALFFWMTYFCHWLQVFTRCTVYLSVLLPAGICLAMMLLSTGKRNQNQTHNQGSAFKIPVWPYVKLNEKADSVGLCLSLS